MPASSNVLASVACVSIHKKLKLKKIETSSGEWSLVVGACDMLA